MKRYLLIMMALLSVGLNSQIINISDNESKSCNPYFISTGLKKYVFWHDDKNGNTDIFYRILENDSWSDIMKIETSLNSQLSSMCVGDSNTIHLLWCETENSQSYLFYGRIRDSIIIDTTKIYTCVDSTIIFSSIVYDDTNKTTHFSYDVSFFDTVLFKEKIFTYYSYIDPSRNFSKANLLLTNNNYSRSQLAIDKNGELLCFYHKADSVRIECIRKTEENSWIDWTSVTTDFPGIGHNFIVKADKYQNIHIVSHPGDLPTCPCTWLLYTNWDGEKWSDVENVPSHTNYGRYAEHDYPDIAFSSLNYPVITWEQKNYGDYLDQRDKFIGTAVKLEDEWIVNGDIEKFRKPSKPKILVDSEDLINYVWEDTSDGDSDIYYCKTSLIVSIESESNFSPSDFKINQNYPNPFNPSTTINIEVNNPMLKVLTIKIYNSIGQQVRIIEKQVFGAGYYDITWDGCSDSGSILPSGVYFYKVNDSNTYIARKMTLIK
ncbi:T9SS type A sorting domain-containing protein [bacterium]|nr:T9SS type A sorting domain-containing protein [bacterium]